MREQKLKNLREWLIYNMPQTPPEERSSNFVRKGERQAILKKKVAQYGEKARLNVAWREELAEQLSVRHDDIVLVTNTILELIEQTLSKGESVRIRNFGDFTVVHDEDILRVRFRADEQWMRSVNGPLYKDEIGVKRTYKKKQLQKRVI